MLPTPGWRRGTTTPYTWHGSRRTFTNKSQVINDTLIDMHASGGRCGVPYLLLTLVLETQTRRPLLEALSIVGPGLVRLELHHG